MEKRYKIFYYLLYRICNNLRKILLIEDFMNINLINDLMIFKTNHQILRYKIYMVHYNLLNFNF